jgi:hypothetical protein
MQEQKQQLLTRLKESTNVLVTVSNNPTVDQLAAAIGFTLALDKQKKHATAVFSGEVPSTLEFLEPEKTIKKNTDSLRDFIISLDRDKADKLRYKVEDKAVKIFISPYRTAIQQEDLMFSQGDFNIDVVVAIGVKEQEDLDGAITAHGRILHDATVATINTSDNGTVGSVHWVNQQASSLSEMMSELALDLHKEALDNQIATALLTGIVAETDRFSNDKTKPNTLAISSKLMAAGANQQLVSSKLEEAKQRPPETLPPPEAPPPDDPGSSGQGQSPEQPPEAGLVDEDGTLRIDHGDTATDESGADSDGPELDASKIYEDDDEKDEDDEHPIHIDETGNLYNGGPPTDGLKDAIRSESGEPPKIVKKPQSAMLTEPPSSQDDMLAPSVDGDDDTFKDPLSDPDADKRNQRILSHDGPADQNQQNNNQTAADQSKEPTDTQTTTQPSANTGSTPPKQDEKPIQTEPQTLKDIEKSVGAHTEEAQATGEQAATPQNDTQLAPSTQSGQSQPAAPQPAQAPQAPSANKPAQQSPAELDQARQAIIDAVNDESKQGGDAPLPPVEALNAQPVELEIHPDDSQDKLPQDQAPPQVDNPNQPPPVPPPMMPPSTPPTNTPPTNPS